MIMEVAEPSVSDLFLAKGDMPLGLNHETCPQTALDHTGHADVKDITLHITGLGEQKLELPIPSEAIIEPISPAEITLEESALTVTNEEETAGSDDPKDSQLQLTLSDASSDPGMPNEITAANSSVLDSNPTEPPSEFVVHTDPSEGPVGSEVTATLDPSALDKEATCENGSPEDSTSNSPRDEEGSKEAKVARKNIPPKKDRMDPLKMDMSKPTVIPLTSSQLSLQCLECHIIFSDNKSKERHLKMNHPTEYEQCMLGDALFACYVCDRHFTCSTELMAHQRTHTEKQPFKCPICGEAFSRSSELTNHKKVHFGKHGYTCSDCGKPCKTLTLLKYHQRIHTGERPYVCLHKECGKRFSMPKALQKHLEAHEKGDTEGTGDPAKGTKKKRNRGPSTKKFACSQCEESFKTAKSQLHHIKSKHSQCKTTTPSITTLAAQELNGNSPASTQCAVVQPPVLRMEAIGPTPQQIGPLGAEQIKRLIEKLGNVQKVNQLVILGLDQLPFQTQTMGMQQPQRVIQPLHFNFTEPTVQPVVVQQTGPPPLHEGTMLTGTEQTTCKESLEVGVAVEQEETMVQEETAMVSSVNPEEQVAAVESDTAGAQLKEVQLELMPELTEKSVSTPPLEVTHELNDTAEEQCIQGTSDTSTVGPRDAPSLISTNDSESTQSQRTEEEHAPVLTDIMAAEETITHEESLEEKPAETDSVVETEPQTEQTSVVTLDNSQDLEGQSEESAKCLLSEQPKSPSPNNEQQDQESSHFEQEPSNETVLQPSTVVTGEQNLSDAKSDLHIKKILPMKKKKSKKQVTHRSQHLEAQDKVAKSSSQIAPAQKTNTPSKSAPKKREKAKSKKLVRLGENKEKRPKQQVLQMSKTSPLKDQQDTNGKVPVSSQIDSAPLLKQKNQKHKKAKTAENSSGAIKAFNLPNEPKVTNVSEQKPRGKAQKRKLEKQKDLAKKGKAQETQQDETPLQKKKKQSKTPEAVSRKKAKVKNGTEICQLAKQGQKEQKSPSQALSQDQIKQQALLLLKGHKQPQLKVHKLDAKATGLEQPLKAKCQTKEIHDQDATVVKAKGGTQNKALKTANQKKKKTKAKIKEPKEDQRDFSHFQKDTSLSSALSRTKPKVPRKRKAPTKIDQEIALSPPFSRLAIGCHDCGMMFSEVSALQEHMASMHSESGLVHSNVTCDVSNSPTTSPRSNEVILASAVHSGNFEIQVSADWDVETEMREIGLGDRDVHGLSFPALSSSPSFPITSNIVEREGKLEDRLDHGTHAGHFETLGKSSTEVGQPFAQVSSTEPDTCHFQTNDKKFSEVENIELGSVLGSSVSNPQESMDIKEELPADVNLVMVKDQSEEDDHVPAQANDSQEASGRQEDESSHSELNLSAMPSQRKLPVENMDPTSAQDAHLTEQSEIKQEEEEMLVQREENQPKTSMTRGRKGRGGRGRGKKQLGKRSTAENRGTKEPETDKEECQVVFQLYSLTDNCEEKNIEREVSGATTAHAQSTLDESLEDQVVFELQPVPSRVAEVLKADDSLVQKSGQQVKNGTSSGVVLENFLTPQVRMRKQVNSQPEEGLTSTGTSTDVKMEGSTSVPASHGVLPSERGLLQGIQVFLVKAEDHETHVLQGNQNMQTHHTTCLDGIPSGSSAVPQSAGKQCIFYPVKEEEGEILVEPPLNEQGETSGLDECEEVSVGCAQMEMHHTLYSSAEEGDVGTEQQSAQGFLEFLSQSSDTDDVDNFQSEPEAETHIMSCYHGIRTNRAVQVELSRNRGHSQEEHQEEGRKENWKPIDYFIQYFSWDTWKEIAAFTGEVSKLPEPVTDKEVAQFVGIHIAMGTLKFPSMKLYWEDCTRVPLIADAMSASRFSELTHKLRLASPTGDPRHTNGDEQSGQKSTNELGASVETPRQIPAAGEKSKPSVFSQLSGYQNTQNCTDLSVSKTEPLWKIQAIVNRVREGCRALKRHGNHGVDQYPLPFQRHPTHSLHHTVMISVTGLVMDFNLRINDSNREEVVEKMVSWEKGDNQGMIFLCKPELSTPSMLEHLLEVGVRSAGKVGGARGQVGDEFMTPDGKLKLFRCHHGFILSAVTKEKSRSTSLVSGFERAIKAANLNRDLRSLYRTPCTSPSAGAWPLSVLWDLIDLALVNSWLQYKQGQNNVSEPLSLMAFRLEVSKALILPSSTTAQESVPYTPAPKRPSPNTSVGPANDFETPLPDAATRYDGLGHWPEQLAEGEEARCRFGGCERTSRVRCLKCCVFLCISRNHNCFLKFHSQGAA
ncbi:uncharacterized protein LOC118823945 isoform X2 [Colossoma macropomum]|uniref:uncharacterized protein LOC118823945 isoform X2 n=1 Tax=Colossoma macropomum TaxID=42526 RepID=UPI0018647130|nr:uncharacterized protein LOC118823945 isoform X2 [Colossoma macropomum]